MRGFTQRLYQDVLLLVDL